MLGQKSQHSPETSLRGVLREIVVDLETMVDTTKKVGVCRLMACVGSTHLVHSLSLPSSLPVPSTTASTADSAGCLFLQVGITATLHHLETLGPIMPVCHGENNAVLTDYCSHNFVALPMKLVEQDLRSKMRKDK